MNNESLLHFKKRSESILKARAVDSVFHLMKWSWFVLGLTAFIILQCSPGSMTIGSKATVAKSGDYWNFPGFYKGRKRNWNLLHL